MSSPQLNMLSPTTAKITPFPFTSRYYGIDTATLQSPDGKTIIYLKRRFVPSADRFALLQEHTVTQAERLDNVTAQYLGDPEAFWRICDANNAMRPEELTERVGNSIRISMQTT